MKRILLFIFSVLISSLTLVYILIQSPPVQNYLIQKVSLQLEKKLETKVTVGSVDINFFRKLSILDVTIYDNQQDTVLHAGRIALNLGSIQFDKQLADLSNLVLSDATIKFIKHEGDSRFSYKYILDKLKTQNKDTAAADWVIRVNEIKLENARFIYEDKTEPVYTSLFDENHMNISGINGLLTDFITIGDTIRFQVERLKCVEKSGLRITDFKALTSIYPYHIGFEKMSLVTPNSSLSDYFAMNFSSYDDFEDFLSLVKLEGHFDKSRLSFKDLAYFSDEIEGWEQIINISGDARGPVDNLKARNLKIDFGKNSSFTGNANFKGLPDVYETYFDIKIDNFKTNKTDLEIFGNGTNLPQEFADLGNIKVKGKLNGFLKDLVVDATVNTEIGSVASDLNLKFPKNEIPSYSGQIGFTNFNLGKIIGVSDIEQITGNSTIEGSGITSKDLKAKIDASFTEFVFNKYTYTGITAEGIVGKGIFEGQAIARDKNVQLDFQGKIDFSTELPTMNFKAEIVDANLKELNFDSVASVLNCKIELEIVGDNIDNIQGGATLPYINISRKGKYYNFKQLKVSSIINNSNRLININSDVIDAFIDGQYNFATLVDAVSNEAAMLFPDYFKSRTNKSLQNFRFNINLQKPNELLPLFVDNLKLRPCLVNGNFNNRNSSYSIAANIPSIEYKDVKISSLVLTATKGEGDSLRTYVTTHNVSVGAEEYATSLSIKTESMQNIAKVHIIAEDSVKSNALYFNGNFLFTSDVIKLGVVPSTVVLNELPWIITSEPIEFRKNQTDIRNLNLVYQGQKVGFDGSISGKENDMIRLTMQNVNLNLINKFVPELDMEFGGLANGNLFITHAYTSPIFITNLGIRDAAVDGDTLGDLNVVSNFDTDNKTINTVLGFTKGKLERLKLIGKIHTQKEMDYLDFDVTLDQTPANVIQFLFKDLASDFEGLISGKLKLKGSFNDPEFTGNLTCQNVGFTIDYIKTHYTFSDVIVMSKSSFTFKNVSLYDKNGNKALAYGNVTHRKFGKWAVDISIKDFKNFLLLDTKKEDNSLFYGVGKGTGSVYLKGPVDDLLLTMNLKSNKGTVINIPLSNPEYSSESSYIKFKDRNSKTISENDYQVDLGGITMDFNLDLTPDAEIQMIFDSQLGDIIKGTGSGNLKMEISSIGEFSMYGEYTIEQGDYLFTKFNIINKKFVVKKGGKINWDGDPYQAKINLEAVYKATAAPVDLFPGETGQNYKQRIPVECILFLKGLLFQPDITFDLRLPELNNLTTSTAADNLRTKINQIRQSQEEVNRQVFSLLILNKFFPMESTPYDAGAGVRSGANASAGDLISNQLTNWLSQALPKWDLGLNYSAKDQTRAAQWVVSINKHFFNDRLVFDGSFDATRVTGNISVQYFIDQDGEISIRVFSKTNNNTLTSYDNVFTNGAGLYVRKEYDTLRRKKKKSQLPKKEGEVPESRKN